MNIHWKCIPFNDLTPLEVYAILGLRQDVFIIEQACIYLDIDGIDIERHGMNITDLSYERQSFA